MPNAHDARNYWWSRNEAFVIEQVKTGLETWSIGHHVFFNCHRLASSTREYEYAFIENTARDCFDRLFDC